VEHGFVPTIVEFCNVLSGHILPLKIFAFVNGLNLTL
jgi:hypothetical protein